MERFLGKYSAYFYAILRIISGLMFAMHGSQKLFGIPGNTPPVDVPLMQVAGVIELVGGLMIALGLLAGYAAFITSGMMAVAFFKQHFQTDNPLPIINRGELAVLYCFFFLYVAAHGGGPYSLDARLGKGSPLAGRRDHFHLPWAARARRV
jgi:putative oxidoreductase